MIVLHIAIRGDNKDLAKAQLEYALRALKGQSDPLARPDVYRAWIEPLDSTVIDREIQQMPEVVK